MTGGLQALSTAQVPVALLSSSHPIPGLYAPSPKPLQLMSSLGSHSLITLLFCYVLSWSPPSWSSSVFVSSLTPPISFSPPPKSVGLVQSTAFSLCSGLLQVPPAVLCLASTIETFLSTTPPSGRVLHLHTHPFVELVPKYSYTKKEIYFQTIPLSKIKIFFILTGLIVPFEN